MIDDATLQEYLALLACTGEHTAGLGSLLREYTSPSHALGAPQERLAALPPATQRGVARARATWPPRPDSGNGPAGLAADAATPPEGPHFIPIVDPRYPALLRETPDPPPWLFCRGRPDALTAPAVAVVGSRRGSRAGLEAAEYIGRRLASRGYLVCSGLALGIDAAVHRGALATGATAAVLASGLDRVSPRQHESLAQAIVSSGCILSELPFGTAPARWRFPRRNRIISGLCAATIIVEAALPSGSLHTAAAALDQGRDVYVLPWSVFHRNGRGGLRLLRDGAQPITELDELDELFPARAGARAPDGETDTPATLEGGDRRLLQLVGDGELGLDELHAGSRLPAPALYAALARLELDGYLERHEGRYRCRHR